MSIPVSTPGTESPREGEGLPFRSFQVSVGMRAWWLLSAFFLSPALAALCLPDRWLYDMAGLLATPHSSGHPCGLCGMTGAFAAIGRGDFSQASQFHLASIPLFGIMLGNALAAGIVWTGWRLGGDIPRPSGRSMKTKRS